MLYDEGLIDNAAATGEYMLDRLRALQAKYPKIIKDVRGKGLMVGLEFQDFSQTLPMVLRPVVSMLDDKLKGSLSGFVGALLLRDYNVLVAFTEYNRNVIRLEPPLICAKACRYVRRRARRPAWPGHHCDRQGFREEPGEAAMLTRAPVRPNFVERITLRIFDGVVNGYARHAALLGAAILALYIVATAAIALVRLDANWDMLAYLAVAEEGSFSDPQQLHAYAYDTRRPASAPMSTALLVDDDGFRSHGNQRGRFRLAAADVPRKILLRRTAVDDERRHGPGDRHAGRRLCRCCCSARASCCGCAPLVHWPLRRSLPGS